MLKFRRGDINVCESSKDEIEECLGTHTPVEKEEGKVEKEETPTPAAVLSASSFVKKKSVILLVFTLVVLLHLVLLMTPQMEHEGGMHSSELEESNFTSWNEIWEKADIPWPSNSSEKKNSISSDGITITSALRSTSLNTSLTAQELFNTFPTPARTDTIQIYNEEAYDELKKEFLFKKNNSILICANGGSSTAGGGHIEMESRYLSAFSKYIRELNLNLAIGEKIVNRGHGTRNSLHSAIFAPNFFPPQTDLLLWEFAINDYAYGANIPRENHIEQERSMLIAWLREVQKMSPKPPKVILIYLWKRPFEFNEKQETNNPVYEAHAQLARDFDFVVGHVNLASYFDELHAEKMLSYEDLKNLFLSDRHHPNVAGHLAVSFLLLNLLRGKGEWSTSTTKMKKNKLEKYDWFCGDESEEKRFIQNRIVDSVETSSGWRSPLRSMTLEQPQNSNSQLELYITSPEEIKTLGKQDPVRIDRQKSVSLKCCSEGLHSSFTTFKVPMDEEPMQNVKAIFLAFGTGLSNMTDMRVYIDSDTNPVHGTLIHVPNDWPCFWSWANIYDTKWFAFSREQPPVSSMSICVESNNCNMSGQSEAMMMSMAVYA